MKGLRPFLLCLPSRSIRYPAAGFKTRAWVPVVLEWALLAGAAGAPAFAESPAVTVRWGGLAFSGQASTLPVDGTINHSTAFDNHSPTSLRSESPLNDTFGINLVSISWTKQWDCSICQGITTKMTAGVVLMPEEPSRLPTDIRNMGGSATSVDGMDAILNKWFSIKQNGDGVAFGTSFIRTGSTLSTDLFGRSVVGGLALPIDVSLPERLSLMGRANLKEQFSSLSYRYEGLKVETWNQTPYNNPGRGDFGVAVAYSVEWDSTHFWDLTGSQRRATARRAEAMHLSAQLK